MKTLILILLFVFSVSAQCELTQKDFSIRGIRLGMSVNEVEKQHKLVKTKDEKYQIEGYVNFEDAKYNLTFSPRRVDNNIVLSTLIISVDYLNTDFKSHSEFNEAVSKSLNLPQFVFFSEKVGSVLITGYRVVCKDFEIRSRFSDNKRTGLTIYEYRQPKPKVFKP